MLTLLAAGLGWAAQVPTTFNQLVIPANLDESNFPATTSATRGGFVFGTDAGVPYWSPGDGGAWQAIGGGSGGCSGTGPCVIGQGGFYTDGGVTMAITGQANEVVSFGNAFGHDGTGLKYENGSTDWYFQKLGAGTSQSMSLQDDGIAYYTWNQSGLYSVSGQITATNKLSSTVASGNDAYQATVNGARTHFGAGSVDYASSDGTSVSFAGPLRCADTKTRGTTALSTGSATVTVTSGAVCVCSVDTAFLACQPSVSGTTLTITVTGGGSNTVSYICL